MACRLRHTKRSHPSFGMTPTFDSADIIDYILEKSLTYQKKDGCGRHPSFGMTMAQAIRDLLCDGAHALLQQPAKSSITIVVSII